MLEGREKKKKKKKEAPREAELIESKGTGTVA